MLSCYRYFFKPGLWNLTEIFKLRAKIVLKINWSVRHRDTSAWKLLTPSYGILFTHNTRLRYPRKINGYLGLRVKCSRGKEDWKFRHARNSGEMRRRAYPLFSHMHNTWAPLPQNSARGWNTREQRSAWSLDPSRFSILCQNDLTHENRHVCDNLWQQIFDTIRWDKDRFLFISKIKLKTFFTKFFSIEWNRDQIRQRSQLIRYWIAQSIL